MKNRKTLGLLVALIVSVLCVSNAFAFNAIARDDSNRVTIGQHYYGDTLLGQIYQTLWDYSTRIKVINTSKSRAIIAKVVFRSAVCSEDVRDFYIYLTPTDMWEGLVRVNDRGVAEIYSTDDSVLASKKFEWDGTAACNPFTGVWASEATPFKMDLGTPTMAKTHGDLNSFGHIEVIGMAAYQAVAPLDKDSLAIVYNQMPGVPSVDATKIINCDFNLVDGTNIEDVPNVLTGTLSLENSRYDQVTTINMIALKNWEKDPITLLATSSSGLNATQYNSVAEIEAALAKTEYAIPFDFSDASGYADIVLVNTLPTLYLGGSVGNEIAGTSTERSGYFITNPGCFWSTCTSCQPLALTGGLAGITYTPYDMMETVLLSYISPVRFMNTLPEVSMQALLPNIQGLVTAGYKKGWVRVGMPLGAAGSAPAMDKTNGIVNVSFTGVPIINSYINIYDNGDLDWNYAASPESDVFYGSTQVRQ